MPTIPQRELRNDIAAILRRAEAGETFTVTVNGRPVAVLGPIPADSHRSLDEILAATPVDANWRAELADMRAADGGAALPE